MTSGTDAPVADGDLFPGPQCAPWTGFSLAADAAVRQLHERLGLDLWLVTQVVGDEQRVVAAAGYWSDLAPVGTALPWQQSFCLPMVERRGPTIAADVTVCPAYAAVASGLWAQVKAYVGIPLQTQDGELFGTLCGLAGRPQQDSLADALGMLEMVAQMLSTILAHEQTAQARSADAAAAYAMAERDRLTGLLNRRGWDAALAQEDLRLQRYGLSTSVLVIDVDGLKEVNDADGHLSGDQLLVRCAQAMSGIARPGDVQARLGGDEFAVLAVECDAHCSRALLARMRVGLRAAGVAASVGTATRRFGEGLADTTARADAAMYADKRRRRHPKGLHRPSR